METSLLQIGEYFGIPLVLLGMSLSVFVCIFGPQESKEKRGERRMREWCIVIAAGLSRHWVGVRPCATVHHLPNCPRIRVPRAQSTRQFLFFSFFFFFGFNFAPLSARAHLGKPPLWRESDHAIGNARPGEEYAP